MKKEKWEKTLQLLTSLHWFSLSNRHPTKKVHAALIYVNFLD